MEKGIQSVRTTEFWLYFFLMGEGPSIRGGKGQMHRMVYNKTNQDSWNHYRKDTT